MRRSARARIAKSAIAIAERTATAAKSARGLELVDVAEDQRAQTGVRAGPLAEDRADHGDRDGDLGAAEEVGQGRWRLDSAQRI